MGLRLTPFQTRPPTTHIHPIVRNTLQAGHTQDSPIDDDSYVVINTIVVVVAAADVVHVYVCVELVRKVVGYVRRSICKTLIKIFECDFLIRTYKHTNTRAFVMFFSTLFLLVSKNIHIKE